MAIVRQLHKLAFLLLCVFGVQLASSTVKSDTCVYICTGPKAYSYHKYRNCRGLNKCSGEIKCVTKEYAKSKNRKPCKICYK